MRLLAVTMLCERVFHIGTTCSENEYHLTFPLARDSMKRIGMVTHLNNRLVENLLDLCMFDVADKGHIIDDGIEEIEERVMQIAL